MEFSKTILASAISLSLIVSPVSFANQDTKPSNEPKKESNNNQPQNSGAAGGAGGAAGGLGVGTVAALAGLTGLLVGCYRIYKKILRQYGLKLYFYPLLYVDTDCLKIPIHDWLGSRCHFLHFFNDNLTDARTKYR